MKCRNIAILLRRSVSFLTGAYGPLGQSQHVRSPSIFGSPPAFVGRKYTVGIDLLFEPLEKFLTRWSCPCTPDSEIRILLQETRDEKTSKERIHIDIETDDIEAEVQRLEALGATRWDHQQERGFDFWVLQDPWQNEFCVLFPHFPELLAQRRPWSG